MDKITEASLNRLSEFLGTNHSLSLSWAMLARTQNYESDARHAPQPYINSWLISLGKVIDLAINTWPYEIA
jgi:hypothetical protein